MQTARNLGDMENYSIYMLNGKMGLAGAPNGETEQVILTQPKYSVIYPFVKGHAIVKVGDYYGVINKYGVVDLQNNILIPFEYDGIGVIENINRNGKNCSYYGVRRNGLSGVIDNNFRECIPIMYSRLEYSKSYNCFVVEVKGDKAMIDINNNIVVPFTSNRLDKHDFY